MGIGSLGGGTQMLFGGSGGQDMFQKTTWVLGAIFIGGSLFLALAKSRQASSYLQRQLAGEQTTMPSSQEAGE